MIVAIPGVFTICIRTDKPYSVDQNETTQNAASHHGLRSLSLVQHF